MPEKTDRFINETEREPLEGFFGMLGLARRAGKVKPGTQVVCSAVRSKVKPSLIIVDSGASDNTKSRLLGLCHAHRVRCIIVRSSGKLGDSIGIVAPLSALAITSEVFSEKLLTLCKQALPTSDTAPGERR